MAFADATTLWLIVALIGGTLISEDIACVTAGALVARGELGAVTAVTACFVGIVAGDLMLYGVGRMFGARALQWPAFRRLITADRTRRATNWLNENVGLSVLVSRFVSGLRLPVYLLAGVVGVNLIKFAFFLIVAAAIWTPILVIGSSAAQEYLVGGFGVAGIVLLVFTIRVALRLGDYGQRRRLIGRIRRLRNWEFWPWWFFYLPVFGWIGLVGLATRRPFAFTATNPAMPLGGITGESKDSIYRALQASDAARPHLLRHVLIAGATELDEKQKIAETFIDSLPKSFPVVIKPDHGERGAGVSIIHDRSALERRLKGAKDLILQEFAGGNEISVFYYRLPDDDNGRIFSVTEKVFPEVVGDGRRTLEELILDDPRAVCLADAYLTNFPDPTLIPSPGEVVRLIEIGTHSRGAIFRDGSHLLTAELARKIDALCRQYCGFHFGRFDLRLSGQDDFRIIELNGVTSESTNIYDPKFTLAGAYRVLFRQWKLAFEIGAANIARGARASSLNEMLSLLRTFFRSRITK